MSSNNKNTIYRLALVYALLIFSELAFSQSIHINITGIRSDQGVLIVSLFENQEQFKSDHPVMIMKASKAELTDSTLIVEFKKLIPKDYGIVVLDDENENGDMDYRLKRPIEGFGFSNYYHKGLFRPKFEDFSFKLEDKDIIIKVVMRYIKEIE